MASGNSYMPKRESDQVAWAAQLVLIVGANPAEYGVPMAAYTAFAAIVDALQAAWAVAANAQTRTRGTVAQKDNCLANMRAAAKNLVSIIQGTPSVTDQMKIDAGLTVRKTTPTKKGPPAVAPYLVLTTSGRLVNVELKQSKAKRGKPLNAQTATIFTATGDAKPQQPDDWTFAMNTSLPNVQLPFGPSATGTTVWVCAFWANAKGESGPSSAAASVALPAGEAMPQATEKPSMKLRAAA